MSTAMQLRELFEPDQLRGLDEVREAMLGDPKIFDTHSREVRGESKPDDPE